MRYDKVANIMLGKWHMEKPALYLRAFGNSLNVDVSVRTCYKTPSSCIERVRAETCGDVSEG